MSIYGTHVRLFSKCKNIPLYLSTFMSTNKLNGHKFYSAQSSTHFGFETVTEDEKARKVHHVFENVSTVYDLMNDINSFGIHRLWKDYFMHRLNPVKGTQLLDVAGGTGDIAFRFLDFIKNLPEDKIGKVDEELISPIINSNSSENSSENDNEETKVVVYDINEAMLEVGKKKAKIVGYEKNVTWIQGDAEKLPFSENSFDAYTVAFGIRNVVHIDKALSEAYRVLKPGGRFMCLEFSQVSNSLIRRVYDFYSFQFIPVFGQVFARDWKSYQYLVESIRQFPDQETFKRMVEDAGFKFTTYENLTFGVTAIHSGFKI